MESELHLKFRIKATSYTSKNEVRTAKVSFIKQEGPYEERRWGLANQEDVSKIYILYQNKEILYVGITKTPLSNRIRSGLKATGKKGYHGYKWKILAKRDQSEIIDLFVYFFKNEERTEAIEAEVVYLIRNKTGRWPKYQTEIHFHHNASSAEKEFAQKIFSQVSAST